MRMTLAAASLLAAVLPVEIAAQETPATKAQKQHEALITKQSFERLGETRKNLDQAIERLQKAPEAPAPNAAPATPGVGAQSAAIQMAEQALLDVRRAIDELDIPQEQRQAVLDRLDDADSAMRMARQPDADREREKLHKALQDVRKEIEVAEDKLPEPPQTGGAK